MKNEWQPTGATFSRNFASQKAPLWLTMFFHFIFENGKEPHPVDSEVIDKDNPHPVDSDV